MDRRQFMQGFAALAGATVASPSFAAFVPEPSPSTLLGAFRHIGPEGTTRLLQSAFSDSYDSRMELWKLRAGMVFLPVMQAVHHRGFDSIDRLRDATSLDVLRDTALDVALPRSIRTSARAALRGLPGYLDHDGNEHPQIMRTTRDQHGFMQIVVLGGVFRRLEEDGDAMVPCVLACDMDFQTTRQGLAA
jgi:hypothetical protein